MSEVVEQLGHVSCPSGTVLILDGGCAWLWSHDRSPIIPELPQIVGAAESARDLAISGPDALAAGEALKRPDNPLYIFDVAENRLAEVRSTFEAALAEHNLNARIDVLEARVPHRRRVDLALDVGKGLGAVNFHGMTAVAIGGLDRHSSFPVLGAVLPSDLDRRWRRVWIAFGEGELSERRPIGHVTVDEARLLAIDADALGSWDDITPADGKADVVFWGRDGEEVARETQAAAIDDGCATIYGWLDMPIDEAERKASEINLLRSDAKRFAVDIRPHTHQWAVMRQVRATSTSSGQLDLGGAKACMFSTTCGDGVFPVYAELGADGHILRAVIEFADDEEETSDGRP